MKFNTIILIIIVICALTGFYIFYLQTNSTSMTKRPTVVNDDSIIFNQESGSLDNQNNLQKEFDFSNPYTLIKDLNVPWEVIQMPNNNILITQRTGQVIIYDTNTTQVIEVDGVEVIGEGGLLGAALHPEFENNSFVYLYLTSRDDGNLFNKVSRYELVNNTLINEKVLIDNIPGARFHDGGRIAFGPDGLLYVTTGDALDPESAQDTNSLSGKILRISPDGTIPNDNPFNNAVYSYGHRNPQGITWDDNGTLWSTEHGPSGLNTGEDELNIIVKGGNYGWPEISGSQEQKDMISPVLQSTKKVTWAPASAQYYNGSIYFGGLRAEALYEYNIESRELKEHLTGDFGRIRNVSIINNNMYITTSNTDGRGQPSESDDLLLVF